MKLAIPFVLVLGAALSASNAQAAQTVLATPRIFASGVISGPANDGSPTFSPDGNTLFFTRFGAGGAPSWNRIVWPGTGRSR